MMSYNSCSHLDSTTDNVRSYKIVLAYYVAFISEEFTERRATEAYCAVCKSADRNLHLCLECVFFGCFDSETGEISHVKDHALKRQHFFAIHLDHGSLFCFKCDDYIYNEAFDDALSEFKLEARKMKITLSSLPWKPNAKDIDYLKGKVVKVADNSHYGLRGIINIGNSCYINCIVQVLMHTPILIDYYYLNDKHKCPLNESESCLACELVMMFADFYGGITFPYDPSKRFFLTLQKFCSQPLGMEQQDCYELFQEILIGLHASCTQEDGTECNCMIQKTFYGIGQGRKVCQHCNDSSILPTDYFMDILIDLDKKDDNLENILKRKYLEPHLLSDYTCTKCKSTDTTHLYQHIKKLPIVICFRMNCFHMEFNQKASAQARRMQKKSTAFSFKEHINMAPYLNEEDDTKPSDKNASHSNKVKSNYRMFAVIFHKGNLQRGHYATYVRQRDDKWFECDDRYIYERSLDDVLQCEPFLLFYQKQF